MKILTAIRSLIQMMLELLKNCSSERRQFSSQTITDNSGDYSFLNVPAGEYVLQ